MPGLQDVLKLLPEDLLNSGGLLSTASSLKDILLPDVNLLPTKVGDTLNPGNKLPLGPSNLGDKLLGGGSMDMKTTPAPSKKQTTTGKAPLGLNVLPSILG